jgi:hypothetical protein
MIKIANASLFGSAHLLAPRFSSQRFLDRRREDLCQFAVET